MVHLHLLLSLMKLIAQLLLQVLLDLALRHQGQIVESRRRNA